MGAANGPMAQNRIRELRNARGMTLEQLAEQAGLSASYLSRLEANKRILSVEVAERLAMSLDARPEDVIGLPGLQRKQLAPGFSDDVAPYQAGPNDPFSRLIDANSYLLEAQSDVLDLAGINKGDVLIANGSAAICANPPPLSPVRVQYHPDPDNPAVAVTLLRQFVPPRLVITNCSRGNAQSLDLERDDAQILAVIVSVHRRLGLS